MAPSTNTTAPIAERPRFTQCPECHGAKYTNNFVICKSCRGIGSYYINGQQIVFWNYPLDAVQLVLRKWHMLLRYAVDGALFMLLLLNIFLVFRLGQAVDFDGLTWMWLLLFSSDTVVGPIWILALPNFYLLYRVLRESDASTSGRKKRVVAKQNIADVAHPSVLKLLDATWLRVQAARQAPVRPLHVFQSLLAETDIIVLLARLGLTGDRFTSAIQRQIGNYAPSSGAPSLDASVEDILLDAYLIATQEHSPRVRLTDVFLATIRSDERIQEILYEFKVDMVKVQNVIKWINFNHELVARYRHYRARAVSKPKGPINRSYTAAATPFLDSYSTDLTQLAKAGQLHLTVAREREYEELFRVIEGGKSVVLVGEKGVGKLNLIEGLANRMAAEDVPPLFQDKRLVSLSLPFLVAGAARTGEVQQRLLMIIQEIVRSGNIILVIEDIHNLVGVSSAGTENIDLSEVLGQQIQSGNVWVIATTTPANMTEFVEKSGLNGVMERIPMPEPGKNQAIQILESHVALVEARYKVFFTYESLEKVIDLAGRYLHDQFLPEKAINLMTEAGSWTAQRESKLITGEDIAALVSRKTNIPLTQVTAKESAVLLNLEQIMHERIVGQQEAVSMVVSALRRARAELRDEKRPIVNLLFLGPTGVGKTELAKTVAESYFGSEDAMIRLDMSEYQHQDSIARLLGAPGGGRGGMLTEAVRSKPFSLLLLDEIEKAHPDILNIFLQVMEDGRLTDAMGRTVDFTNIILVATSNAGAHYIQDEVARQTPIDQIKNELVRNKLRDVFRPEFLNRFDGIVVFRPLSSDEIYQVAGLMLKKVAKRLETKGIAFQVTPEAQKELAQAGFDPIFGARPLRRVIQERVDDALASYLLQGSIGRRDHVIYDVGGQIKVTKAQTI